MTLRSCDIRTARTRESSSASESTSAGFSYTSSVGPTCATADTTAAAATAAAVFFFFFEVVPGGAAAPFLLTSIPAAAAASMARRFFSAFSRSFLSFFSALLSFFTGSTKLGLLARFHSRSSSSYGLERPSTARLAPME